MHIDRLFKAALAGAALVLAGLNSAAAQDLRVLRGEASGSLVVPVNRAVVVEAETAFAELSIANPGIADISTLSDRTIYVLGRAPGRTTMTLLGPEGNLIANIEVQVTPDIAEFKERLRQILPGEPIEVRTANDGIVLSGTVSSITRLDRALELAGRYAPGRVLNMMSVGGTQQVMLKVRFAEMERSVAKALEAGITAVEAGSSSGITIAGGSGSLTSGSTPGTGGTLTLNPEAIGQMSLGFNVGSVGFNVLVEALETKGLIRTLSEPNLTALSGQDATFLAGGEYPVPVVDDDGNVSVEFRPFGVGLNFTPRVVDEDIINLELTASVSGLDPTVVVQQNGFAINGFRRRETSTVVEMRDGESFAIAGLLQDDFQDLVGQVPWLGDIPVLGALFRSADFERRQSELVIIVTPHLVTPVRGEALMLSTDRVRPPSESELFLLGRTSSQEGAGMPTQGAAGEVAKQEFTGSYGYVME
ncbi:MAG: type II and III secretion system protein family protein [Pseudomonadota bacterium]